MKRFRRKKGKKVWNGWPIHPIYPNLGEYIVDDGKLIRMTNPRTENFITADAYEPMLIKPPKDIAHWKPIAVYEDGEIFWKW